MRVINVVVPGVLLEDQLARVMAAEGPVPVRLVIRVERNDVNAPVQRQPR